jgi:hypothetical protein
MADHHYRAWLASGQPIATVDIGTITGGQTKGLHHVSP